MTFERSAKRAVRVRTRLLVTAAAGLVAVVAPAHAQDAVVSVAPESQASGNGPFTGVLAREAREPLLPTIAPEAQSARDATGARVWDDLDNQRVAISGYADISDTPTNYANKIVVPAVAPEPEVVIANPGTTVTARDPVNITGVGQVVVDAGGGSVGLCTATLINPRTVIFAAHCVNSRATTAYGANSGGTAIGIGFETNTRANAAGQTDELVRWLLGGTGGAGKFQTNTAQAFYNANWVNYNPGSLEPAAATFLYGDVAIASLDTPAADIPTWAMLFSPLPAPSTITAAGTGYNVGIVGYGGIGTGQTGQTSGSDFRRRAADNILGALTDLETFEGFLFGGAPNGLKQNLYFVDFDDPRRGGLGASPFDFNAFRDNARPNEGITAPGDSGGPLILQNFSKQLVIGVLSGGYSRFFNGQTSYSYGAVSFYQPLYLYWDWIAANNPYHYVTAKAGDGSWTDATRWLTTLDPAYMILSNGQPVNGIPTLTGEQTTGTSGDFGQICFQTTSLSDCLDTKTGVETVNSNPIGTAGNNAGSAVIEATNNAGSAVITPLAGVNAGFDGVTLESQATAAAPPAATLANGLPGASNFVPNNADPVRTSGTAPRYFDVTLANAGTTTLSGANITIDRLTIGTANAGLVVASGASLTTLINTNQFAGLNTVNGTFTTVGDYSLLGGTLLGTGTINAPFLTSVLGRIAPGTAGTTGTLTINGNLVLSTGNTYLLDLGDSGTSDRIAVTASQFNGTTPLNGKATLGGVIAINPTSGTTLRAGNTYTILTAQGGITGTFAAPTALSAILTPTLTYTSTQVSMLLRAGRYENVIDMTSRVQRNYASLLDQNRATNQDRFSSIYDPLDLSNAATIRATFESLAPRTETLKTMMGITAIDGISRFYRNHIGGLSGGEQGGTVAMVGKPMQFAALAAGTLMPGQEEVMNDSSNAPAETPGLSDNVGLYFSGGYIDGESDAMTGSQGSAQNDFTGFFAATGVDIGMGDNGVLGFGLSYSRLRGPAGTGQYVKSSLIQGTLYAKQYYGNIVLDGVIGAGVFDVRTRRDVALPGATYQLKGRDRAFTLTSEFGAGYEGDFGTVAVTPRVALRAARIEFSPTDESGGGPALRYDRETYHSVQGRGGLTIAGKDATAKPFVSANYVHEFEDRPGGYFANFVGSVTPDTFFLANSQDKDWAEAAVGLELNLGGVALSASAESSFFRDDVKDRTYRGSITFKF